MERIIRIEPRSGGQITILANDISPMLRPGQVCYVLEWTCPHGQPFRTELTICRDWENFTQHCGALIKALLAKVKTTVVPDDDTIEPEDLK